MAIKHVSKENWPELKKFLNRDGYRFLTEYIETQWKLVDNLYEMIDQLTQENQKLKDKLGED